MRYESNDEFVKNGFHNRFNGAVMVKKGLSGWKAGFRCSMCNVYSDIKNLDLIANQMAVNQCLECGAVTRYMISGKEKEYKEVLE